MSAFYLLYTLFCCLSGIIHAHMKFIYPIPRQDLAGIKTGPCGNSDFNDGVRTILQPNSVVTLVIEEVIHHNGAPYRIALSHVNEDSYEDCILLDHIPQHTYSRSANALYINVTIPDVNCRPCALQALSVMTDKIPQGDCCQYLPDGTSGSCFSNYHSCSNVLIDGSEERNGLKCEQPNKWPYREWNADIYTQESSSMYWREVKNTIFELELELVIGGREETNPCMEQSNATIVYSNHTEKH